MSWLIRKMAQQWPGGLRGWRVSDGEGEYWYFDTWQQAMNHADEMSRTVEVTLPRVGSSVAFPGSQIRVFDGVYWVTIAEEGLGTAAHVSEDDIKELGLALLALHYGKQS